MSFFSNDILPFVLIWEREFYNSSCHKAALQGIQVQTPNEQAEGNSGKEWQLTKSRRKLERNHDSKEKVKEFIIGQKHLDEPIVTDDYC